MNIAITGGMGAGKSSVSTVLSRLLGARTINSDLLCERLLEKGNAGWCAMKKRWGTLFFDDLGNVNRAQLRDELFSDQGLRQGLENILHPLVRKQIKSRMRECRRQDKIFLAEIPLLFEVGWQDDFDQVVTVYADYLTCTIRIASRDKVSRGDAEKAISTQMSGWEKAMCADSVINNSGSFVDTILQIYHFVHLVKNSS